MTISNKDVTVSFKLNENTKDDANALYNHLGLSMSSALKMFVHQSLIQHGIPLQARDDNYDYHTQRAVNQAIKGLSKNNNIERHHLIEK